MNNSRYLGVTLAVTGILLFSSKAVLVKLAYQYGADSVSLLLLRMLFAFPFYMVIALLKRPQTEVSGKDYLWIVGLGIIGYYLASYLDFLGLQYVKASLERLILFVYPTLVLLISFVFLGKRVSRRQIAGVVVTYLGVVVIFGSELTASGSENVLFGGLLIFLSALTYAGYLVGSGWIIPKIGARLFTSYAMMVSCIVVVIHFLLQPHSSVEGVFAFEEEVYWLALLMAVFATVVPSFLISYAIRMLGANTFSLFGSLGPVSTIVLAYFFLGETLTWWQVAGALVVISGIFLAEKGKGLASIDLKKRYI
ncbi:DMT family transporter [Marinoscillum furvescens]|uniref:Threonine/homoserine efflux transporter RhtA n=1 Tax=Marinoscillum furvescens DSM 4134 TaxID=1122208 RepID=A0A3D9L9N0_MARFU|nr:DMT family transporter [Marinoscillum furvescens]REE01772.1 threonine/homoserine efflux transporter RhtA [Marinoscillum furvescens DSM 4134]